MAEEIYGRTVGEVDVSKTPVWFDPEDWEVPRGLLLVGKFEGEKGSVLFYAVELTGTAGTAVEYLSGTMEPIRNRLRAWRYRMDCEE